VNHFECFAWGFLGSAFEKTVFWAGLIHDRRFPTFARKRKYWVVTGLLVFFGGILACAVVWSNHGETSPLECFVLGYSSISFIKQLAKLTPPGGVAGGGESKASPRPNLMDFLRA